MNSTGSPLSDRFVRQLDDDEFRHEYMTDQMRLRVALLIRTLREQRGWSQEDLAERMETSQSAVSRIENPDYGKLAVQTLLDAARVFKLPLLIDMPDWADWLSRMREHSSAKLQRESFDSAKIIEQQEAATIPTVLVTISDKWSRASFSAVGAGKSMKLPNVLADGLPGSSAQINFNSIGNC